MSFARRNHRTSITKKIIVRKEASIQILNKTLKHTSYFNITAQYIQDKFCF